MRAVIPARWLDVLNEDGLPVRICPVCDLHIPEPHDHGIRYAQHFIAQHQDEEET